jgi:hypothetical protein
MEVESKLTVIWGRVQDSQFTCRVGFRKAINKVPVASKRQAERYLLLAGGNNIGTNAGQSVAAQLFCGDQLSHRLACRLRLTATSKSMRYSPLCRYPATCETPALLIRSINLTTGALSGFGSPWGFPTSMIMIGIEPR